jgi:hypothetical protein
MITLRLSRVEGCAQAHIFLRELDFEFRPDCKSELEGFLQAHGGHRNSRMLLSDRDVKRMVCSRRATDTEGLRA